MTKALPVAMTAMLTLMLLPSASAFAMQPPQLEELEMSEAPPIPCSQPGDSPVEQTVDFVLDTQCFAITTAEGIVNPLIVEVNLRIETAVGIGNDYITTAETVAESNCRAFAGSFCNVVFP